MGSGRVREETRRVVRLKQAKSGLFYTNKIVLAYLTALEVLGINGLKAVMRKAGLEEYLMLNCKATGDDMGRIIIYKEPIG